MSNSSAPMSSSSSSTVVPGSVSVSVGTNAGSAPALDEKRPADLIAAAARTAAATTAVIASELDAKLLEEIMAEAEAIVGKVELDAKDRERLAQQLADSEPSALKIQRLTARVAELTAELELSKAKRVAAKQGVEIFFDSQRGIDKGIDGLVTYLDDAMKAGFNPAEFAKFLSDLHNSLRDYQKARDAIKQATEEAVAADAKRFAPLLPEPMDPKHKEKFVANVVASATSEAEVATKKRAAEKALENKQAAASKQAMAQMPLHLAAEANRFKAANQLLNVRSAAVADKFEFSISPVVRFLERIDAYKIVCHDVLRKCIQGVAEFSEKLLMDPNKLSEQLRVMQNTQTLVLKVFGDMHDLYQMLNNALNINPHDTAQFKEKSDHLVSVYHVVQDRFLAYDYFTPFLNNIHTADGWVLFTDEQVADFSQRLAKIYKMGSLSVAEMPVMPSDASLGEKKAAPSAAPASAAAAASTPVHAHRVSPFSLVKQSSKLKVNPDEDRAVKAVAAQFARKFEDATQELTRAETAVTAIGAAKHLCAMIPVRRAALSTVIQELKAVVENSYLHMFKDKKDESGFGPSPEHIKLAEDLRHCLFNQGQLANEAKRTQFSRLSSVYLARRYAALRNDSLASVWHGVLAAQQGVAKVQSEKAREEAEAATKAAEEAVRKIKEVVAQIANTNADEKKSVPSEGIASADQAKIVGLLNGYLATEVTPAIVGDKTKIVELFRVYLELLMYQAQFEAVDFSVVGLMKLTESEVLGSGLVEKELLRDDCKLVTLGYLLGPELDHRLAVIQDDCRQYAEFASREEARAEAAAKAKAAAEAKAVVAVAEVKAKGSVSAAASVFVAAGGAPAATGALAKSKSGSALTQKNAASAASSSSTPAQSSGRVVSAAAAAAAVPEVLKQPSGGHANGSGTGVAPKSGSFFSNLFRRGDSSSSSASPANGAPAAGKKTERVVAPLTHKKETVPLTPVVVVTTAKLPPSHASGASVIGGPAANAADAISAAVNAADAAAGPRLQM